MARNKSVHAKFIHKDISPQSIFNQSGSLDAEPEDTEITIGTKICDIHTIRTYIGMSILKRTHGTCPNLNTVETLCPEILALLAWSLLTEK